MSKAQQPKMQAPVAQAVPTTAAEFRRYRREGLVRTLSTGRVIRQRPVDLMRMMAKGEVPDHLTEYVMHMVWTPRKEDNRTEEEKIKQWLQYLDWVAASSLMELVLTESSASDNEIEYEDLLYEELTEIHDWARTPFEQVKPFREGEDSGLEPVSESGEVQPAAE